MHSWTGGYVADLEYASNFHTQLSPHHMHAAAALNGWAPAPLAEDFTYCELGCGVGHTLAVLAAANPRARFVGVDFLPGHVLAARELATKGGLANVEFVEASFQELVQRGDALPACDIIALHGVWSWVSAENRQAIVRLLARHLKTGGLAYVSYNALPGLAQGLPIQRLLLELSRTRAGRSDVRFRHALAFIARLAEAGAAAVHDNPSYRQIAKVAAEERFAYLAHEYMNDSWTPMYFADVAAALEEAKLGFIGPVDPARSFRALTVSPEQAALLDEIEDPVLRETVADYCSVNPFRRDLFARGARRLSTAEQDRVLRSLRLCLIVPPSRLTYSVKVAVGEAAMNEAAYRPIFAALAEGPRKVGELVDLAGRREHASLHAGEVLGMTVASNQAAVAAPTDPTADVAVGPLNRAIAQGSLAPGHALHEALAAPALGSGLPTDMLDRMIYLGLDDGVAAEPGALADHVIPLVLARGDSIIRDGEPIEDEAERRARVAERMGEFIAERLPLWRQLKIL